MAERQKKEELLDRFLEQGDEDALVEYLRRSTPRILCENHRVYMKVVQWQMKARMHTVSKEARRDAIEGLIAFRVVARS